MPQTFCDRLGHHRFSGAWFAVQQHPRGGCAGSADAHELFPVTHWDDDVVHDLLDLGPEAPDVREADSNVFVANDIAGEGELVRVQLHNTC